MSQRYDVVIGGGSFAGLALACGLGQSLSGECRIAIIERQPAAADTGETRDGRAVALSAASVRLLTALGIWPGLAPRAQPIAEIDITDTALEATVRLPVLSYRNRIEGDEVASHVIETRHLSRALTAAALATAGVTYRSGRAISSAVAETSGVRVSLDDGSTLQAALVVAADGRASQLRTAAGIKTVAWGHTQTGIITIVAHELPHAARAVQHFLPAGPFAILPLPGASSAFPTGGRSCVTWTEDTARAAEILRLDDTGILVELERRFGAQLGTLALDAPCNSYPLETVLARTYIANRLALIGDAAHAVHPIAGQGLNLALRDVAALTDVIADAARLGLDIGGGEPLERYERWRRFDSTIAAVTMDGLNRIFSNDWVLARTLRDAGAGVIDRLPSLKNLLVRQAAGIAGETPRLLQGRLA